MKTIKVKVPKGRNPFVLLVIRKKGAGKHGKSNKAQRRAAETAFLTGRDL